MREVRPTIKVIRTLPRESFADPTAWEQIKNKDWADLRLYGLEQPLLIDARRRFDTQSADIHQESTKAAGRRVYEVRDRSGAGWRGAVIVDDDGDPWLVYVDRHDAFHSSAAAYFKSRGFLPTPAEYKIRDREEAESAFRRWQGGLLRQLTDAIVRATNFDRKIRITINGHRTTDHVTFEVSVDHDPPAVSAAEAHQSSSLVTVILKVRAVVGDAFRQEVLHTALPFLQPDASQYESAYGRDGSMTHLITLTHARLIQFAANIADGQPVVAQEAFAPTHLHYVGIEYLVEGFITGSPVRGVCGTWFVPTRDDTADLPVCVRCDDEMPIAEAVLEMIKTHQH